MVALLSPKAEARTTMGGMRDGGLELQKNPGASRRPDEEPEPIHTQPSDEAFYRQGTEPSVLRTSELLVELEAAGQINDDGDKQGYVQWL